MTSSLLSCLLAIAATGDAQAIDPASPASIEPQVLAELAADAEQRATVVVLLRDAPPARGPGRALERRMQAVAEQQERVLARVPATFELRYRYLTFAGLTGTIDAAGLTQLAADPDVVAIGADVRTRGSGYLAPSLAPALTTSVAYVNADDVHALGLTGEGVTVAVLDSGVDSDHEDLVDDLTPGAWRFLGQGTHVGPGAEDQHGHGTNVAGIVTSGGIQATVGVAPDAGVLAVRVLDANNSGFLTDAIAGVDYVTSLTPNRPDLCVINMSLGSDLLFGACPCDGVGTVNQAFHAATLAARDAGLAIFASSGNQGSCTQMTSPACLSSVVAVAAVYEGDLGREPDIFTYRDIFSAPFADCADETTAADRVTCFSNRSGCNDLAAPGRAIRSSGRGGGTSTFTGTSHAAPHCAGAAALLYAAAGMTPARAEAILRSTGAPTTAPCGTSPSPIRIDVHAAVLSAFETTFCDVFDGSLAACPCGNPGAPLAGCDLSQATGGVRLTLLAQETAPQNRATVLGTGYPPSASPAAVVIRSQGLDPGAPVVFGDGLRCVGVPLVRLGATLTFLGFGTHTFGHGAMAGTGEFHYQIWFRNTPAAFCTPAGFNVSNGQTLVW